MTVRLAFLACALALGGCIAPARGAELPDQLAPPAPFPLVLTQSREREFVAPGIERATYRLQTTAGPFVISLVHIDPHEPSVRLRTVLAHDRIVSPGETISAMAARTGAVAGINADYFDIGNTNTPLGVVAQNGALIRTPSTRSALTIARDRSTRFGAYRFAGSAVVNGSLTIGVTSINEWPPHDGAAFLTPAYGIPASVPDTVITELTPVAADAGLPAAAAPASTRYRVTRIDTDTLPAQPVYALAFGPAAQNGLSTLPAVGDLIDVQLQTDPPLTDVLDAIGGGPQLLANGNAVDDPASPGYIDRARRIPAAAAAQLPDGDLVLAVVDGRHPAISIGVDRAELIAFLAGLGATDALQFDSGGSATLVARVLGEDRATVQNQPSDGVERPVADGLLVYSDAPIGPPARLVVRPSVIEALPGTEIPLRSTLVDSAGHPLGPARGTWHIGGAHASIGPNDVFRAPDQPVTTTLQLERDGVDAEVPLEIVAGVKRIAIEPERPDPQPGASVTLHAQAFDEIGRPVDVGTGVVWTALRGKISANGTFIAGDSDGTVTASAGGAISSAAIHVGAHAEPLRGFAPAEQAQWRFSSVPAGGPGWLSFSAQGTLQLRYDFRSDERAAYANAGVSVGDAVGLSCAIDGDANGAGVRAAFLDRYGERQTLTLAKTVDWTGAQRRDIAIPSALAPPLVLQSFYVIGSLGAAPNKSAGTIGIRSCELRIPGTALHAP